MDATEEKNDKNTGKKRKAPSTAFKVGNPGGPGRPRKGSDLAGILKDMLDEQVNIDNGTTTRGEVFVKSLYARALRGGDGASNKILNYAIGLPTQRMIIESDTSDIKIVIRKKDEEQVAANLAHISKRRKKK